VLLARFGIGAWKLKQAQPYVIVGAFIIAAVFAAGRAVAAAARDPLCLLYELGIFWPVCRQAQDADETAAQEAP
jgi:sec-independent protein translocase protein TatC